MIRIVVTGSECTGKTTLAASLGERFGVSWVTEYGRRFVREKGAAPEFADVDAIARGQIALEDAAIAAAPRLIVQDTDLLSTIVYSRHYYGACPAWIERALAERPADLYLLAGIDVPWTADGAQRDRGDRRQEMHDLFRQALVSRGLRFIEIEGSPSERLRRSTRAIDRLLAS